MMGIHRIHGGSAEFFRSDSRMIKDVIMYNTSLGREALEG